MEYLEAKTAATPTTDDRGQFEALVATWDRDRGGDVIRRGAFAKSIREWRSIGRLVPLHDNHKSEAIVGEVDPESMAETRDGLRVAGRVDLDTKRGRELWRSLKRGRIAFSFGYLATKERERRDGGRDLLEVDVYEISLTPSPMNNRTRVISTKTAASGSPEVLAPDWKDEPRYSDGGKLISYRQMMVDMDVRKAMEEIEAQEAKALKEAEAEASAARARELVPITNRPFTDDQGRHPAACAARDCGALATNPNGSLRLVPDRRWWCDTHRDQAGPEDHLPEEPTYIQSATGFGLRLNPNSAKGRQARRDDERRREAQRQRREADEREAKALAEVEERYRREAVINVHGVRVHPDGRLAQ